MSSHLLLVFISRLAYWSMHFAPWCACTSFFLTDLLWSRLDLTCPPYYGRSFVRWGPLLGLLLAPWLARINLWTTVLSIETFKNTNDIQKQPHLCLQSLRLAAKYLTTKVERNTCGVWRSPVIQLLRGFLKRKGFWALEAGGIISDQVEWTLRIVCKQITIFA